MSLLVRNRYLCPNIGGCDFADNDHLFGEADFALDSGRCPAGKGGCGGRLEVTKPLDLRARALVASLFVMVTGAFGLNAARLKWFPPPITELGFETRYSEVNESDRLIELVVVRSGPANRKVDVAYATIPGQAEPGADYTPAEGVLTFSPGQRRQVIAVNILPDSDFLEPPEQFSVQLKNVQGNSEHQILIGTSKENYQAYDATLAQVRALSALSIEIGKYFVKLEGLGELISQSEGLDALGQRVFFKKYNELKDNMQRAQVRYLELFEALAEHEPTVVVAAFEEWATHLNREQQDQQAASTAVALDQLLDYFENGGPLIDQWSAQLGSPEVIPRVERGSSGSEGSPTEI